VKVIKTIIIAALYAIVPVAVFAGKIEDAQKLFDTLKCENCDLSGFDLRKLLKRVNHNLACRARGPYFGYPLDLSGSNLKGTNLKGVDFSYAVLEGANLKKAQCANADFTNADLVEVNGDKGNFDGAKFYNARLNLARFVGASMKGADFSGSYTQFYKDPDFYTFPYKLFNPIMTYNETHCVNFRQANLQGARFFFHKIKSASFRDANIDGVQGDINQFVK
jgi:uncharacterized protein YjbI with pentapeptide repeats